jgi:hypothetical protein
METKRWIAGLASGLLMITLGVFVSACGAEPEVVDHSFGFDALIDSPGIRILNYRYGDSKFPGARNTDEELKLDRLAQRTGITGPMRRPDSLYVKWLVRSDNKIYEDTVDLRKRLPRDIRDLKVYYMVQGPQLYVYLIYPGPREPGVAPNGPVTYRDRKVVTIYPDQPKQ